MKKWINRILGRARRLEWQECASDRESLSYGKNGYLAFDADTGRQVGVVRELVGGCWEPAVLTPGGYPEKIGTYMRLEQAKEAVRRAS